MDNPRLEIDLKKIIHNTRTIVNMCRKSNIEVVGVTKGVSGIPQVAEAMIQGGVSLLADSRLLNIKKFIDYGINFDYMLIRIPRISRVRSVIEHTSISLNSETKVLERLSKTAQTMGKVHKIMLMVDVGDLREGIMPRHVIRHVGHILSLRGISLIGLGTNVGCFGGVLPTRENMGTLIRLATEIKSKYRIRLDTISVGGTNCLELIKTGMMPRGINQIRIGEGILVGRDGTRGISIPGTYQDAFKLIAEIIEVKTKPTKPVGKISRDAFGEIPEFKDRGLRKRGVIALGKQDINLDSIIPFDAGIRILGGSSDHIILDISDSKSSYETGDEITFSLKYAGLLSASTSPYVSHLIKR